MTYFYLGTNRKLKIELTTTGFPPSTGTVYISFPLKVSSIEPMHIQKWQIKLMKTLKPSYVRGIQGLFSMSMDRGCRFGLAKENPSKIVGNVKKQKTKVDFWTKDEFKKVISLIYKKDYYQHFIFISLVFLFMTGIRIGEATAIQWSDIDFESGILKIEKNLYYKNLENYRFVETKTKASQRHIVLDSYTLSLLQEWKEKYNENAIFQRERAKPPIDTGFLALRKLFPFNSPRWLTCNIISNPVNMRNFINDS